MYFMGRIRFQSSGRTRVHKHAISSLLPLFPDKSKSVAMIHHAVNMIRRAVTHINPGQVPVIALDQPLYAVAKQIQWSWPESYGEHHVVIMFGGLHIEMAFLRLLGRWLETAVGHQHSSSLK